MSQLEYLFKYGEAPTPTLTQKISLSIYGHAFYKWIKTKTDLDYLPVYLVRCLQHGLYLDSPHGYSGYFACDKCLLEREQKRHVPDTSTS
jgi:hypothetical protein